MESAHFLFPMVIGSFHGNFMKYMVIAFSIIGTVVSLKILFDMYNSN